VTTNGVWPELVVAKQTKCQFLRKGSLLGHLTDA
jgi:hypothetical protein